VKIAQFNRLTPTIVAALLELNVETPARAAEADKTEAETTLPTVTVKAKADAKSDQAYVAKRSSAGSKTDTPLIETPQAISVIDSQEVAARAAQNITQAEAYTPGLLSGMFGPSTRDDYFNLRGFDAPNTWTVPGWPAPITPICASSLPACNVLRSCAGRRRCCTARMHPAVW